MTKDEALQKIRKLLETKGRTNAEADTAQILAAAIAGKHGIDIAAIDRAEEERRNVITHWAVGEWAHVPLEARCAANICSSFFEITPITGQRRVDWFTRVETLNFIGTEHHLTIAQHVFAFLLREFRWQWRHKRGRVKKRDQFIWGCFCALQHKLEQRFARPAAEGETAVEISWKARRMKYKAEVFGPTVVQSFGPKQLGAAASRGLQAGKDIEIRPGVKAGDGRKPEQIEEGQKLLGY